MADWDASYQTQPRVQVGLEGVPNERCALQGRWYGYNTLETFKSVDKNQLLKDADFSEPTNPIVLLTYADLKNHKVLYWFAFPALTPKKSIQALDEGHDVWSVLDAAQFSNAWTALRRSSDTLPPFFLYHENTALPLTKETLIQHPDALIVVLDTAPASATRPAPVGWPVRNLIAFLACHTSRADSATRILCFRPGVIRRLAEESDASDLGQDTSYFLTVQVPNAEDYADRRVVGWEPNLQGQPGPRWVSLKNLLDPHHLAVQAADLNLKLMKWRMIPNLQVEKLQSTKVLIIGAGTLGCSVARVLLGWGIRHVHFVDYGKVSYSNPVRQSLFTLKDCEGGYKAEAAAQALKTIAADVESEGTLLSIPMPGHPDAPEAIDKSVAELDQLVQACDVVYLLTDTRESRWLPTVLAAAHDKLLLNAALGLDSWLVMRHGGGYGCYFCNDVVAPENSTKNRTLDQQCTVTRPGLAPIASSMAVELMVALLHHPDGVKAPAPATMSNAFSPTTSSSDSPLGVIPHQIRGSLVSYTMMTPTVPAFAYCTACSPAVVAAYRENPQQLIQETCRSMDGSYLENLTGLKEFRAQATAQMEDLDEWDDEEGLE